MGGHVSNSCELWFISENTPHFWRILIELIKPLFHSRFVFLSLTLCVEAII